MFSFSAMGISLKSDWMEKLDHVKMRQTFLKGREQVRSQLTLGRKATIMVTFRIWHFESDQ